MNQSLQQNFYSISHLLGSHWWAVTWYALTHSCCVGIKVAHIHSFVDFHQSLFQRPSALNEQSQRDELNRRSKCTRGWSANERFCQWTRPAPCTQSTKSVRAAVPKDYERYFSATSRWKNGHHFVSALWLWLHEEIGGVRAQCGESSHLMS